MRNLVLVEHDPFFEEILIMAALEQLIAVSASFGPTAVFSNGKNAYRQTWGVPEIRSCKRIHVPFSVLTKLNLWSVELAIRM